MKYTANHKLKLPEPADTLDIEVLDENFINIDALIAAVQSGKADKNSPQFTGTPKAATPSASDNSTRIATTAFVQGLIQGLQTALAGKADKNSPSLTGTPIAPTAASGTNSTQIATTAFVQSLINKLKQTELQPVTIANSFELISASGRTAFYHGTLTGFFDESSLLNKVQTTFGEAVFGSHYGSFSAQPGSLITLYIRLYFKDSQIQWDEYYNDYPSDLEESIIEIGTATVSDHQAGGATYSEFSYINDNAEEPKEYSLRDAIYALARQVQFLHNTKNENAYLGDVIDFIDIDIIHLQYGGHSEYAFYRYRCSGARLKDGTYVSNTSGKYTDYGSRYMGGSIGNFVIGFNPNAIIVLPVTALTLENNLYAGEAVSSYKTVNAADITDWTDEREEDDYTYALYETASVRVYNS